MFGHFAAAFAQSDICLDDFQENAQFVDTKGVFFRTQIRLLLELILTRYVQTVSRTSAIDYWCYATWKRAFSRERIFCISHLNSD
jgi:hypothetical protein